MEILLIFVTPYFPRADAILSFVANANYLLLITPLEELSFSWGYALHFVVRKVFICNMLSACLRLSISTSISCFLSSFWSSSCRNNFFFEERQEFGEADLLQRFNDNESGEVCCLILRVWFWQVAVYFSLALPSTTHHRVQLVLGMNQGGPIRLGWDRDTRPVYSSWV